FAVFFIAGKIVSKSFDLVLTSLPNRAAGIIFGGIKGFLVVTVLFLIIRSIGNGDEFLRKYVTPDKTTDEIINKGMDLAEGLRNDDDNKDKIEFFNKNIPDSTAYKEDKNTKIYSRLGYGAYKISTMMDPFVNNVKSMVKR
ncbi:MAG: CvpA family protein, partial [Candidatus Delongbacteria bacterium]|nr:CvpA family protein [Candidatus Delongbacteria bacterium]